MAAIVLRLVISAVLILPGVLISSAAEPGVVRSQLHDIATSLSAGNPAAAMESFSKSFADYDRLRNYFTGLTGGFTITNEVDVSEEQDTALESKATARWSITLNSASDNHSNQRTAEIHIRSVKEKRKWKIVEFSPIGLFDPSEAQSTRSP